MTALQRAARYFVFVWYDVSARYGRRTYNDFRVQWARKQYLEARSRANQLGARSAP